MRRPRSGCRASARNRPAAGGSAIAFPWGRAPAPSRRRIFSSQESYSAANVRTGLGRQPVDPVRHRSRPSDHPGGQEGGGRRDRHGHRVEEIPRGSRGKAEGRDDEGELADLRRGSSRPGPRCGRRIRRGTPRRRPPRPFRPRPGAGTRRRAPSAARSARDRSASPPKRRTRRRRRRKAVSRSVRPVLPAPTRRPARPR